MPARQTAKALGITRPLAIPHVGLLAPQQVARLVMETITRFCHSDAPQVEPWHVPKSPGLEDPASVAVLREALVPLAHRAWTDLSDPDGRLRFTHDCYLKLWQLSDPRLRQCCIRLDRSRERDCRHENPPPRPAPLPRFAFAGFCFPPDVIVLAVRWYLRFGLSYRDLEELLAERGVEVDHVSIYRWVLRFTPLLADAARPCRHRVGDRWQVDETYVKVAGRWRYVYRAIDQFGQVIDVFMSRQRDARAARQFFEQAVGTTRVAPVEVTTDRAPVYPAVLEALLPVAWHRTDQDANNRVECDHGRLKARLRPMGGLKQDRNAKVIIAGHAFVQNLRRGHYELVGRPGTGRR
jgi:transposase-like protein